MTFVEVLVATTLSLVVLAAVMGVAHSVRPALSATPDIVEMEQRLRAGIAAIARDVRAAGAGLDHDPMTGPLGGFLPVVVPRRIGAVAADSPQVARGNVLSLVYVPVSTAQAAALAGPMAGGTIMLDDRRCPTARPACGFEPGMGTVVFDALGRYGLFTVSATSGVSIEMRPRGVAVFSDYDARAYVAPVFGRSYYLDSGSRTLREYDLDQTDAPVIDDVVELAFAYYGTAAPPTRPRPPVGVANCLYDVAGDARPGLASLVPGPSGLAELPLSMLADGPWCGSGSLEFDVDLLRVRRVRITLGVRAGRAAGSREHRPADTSMTVDVGLRNVEFEP